MACFIFLVSLICWPCLSAASLALDFSGSIFSDPARPIEVKVGQEFALLLESNPTTGYQWQLDDRPDSDVVVLVLSEYQGSSANRLGAGGSEIWVFQATGPGEAVITLSYLRPWENQSKPAKTASFLIKVKAPPEEGQGKISPDEAKSIIADRARLAILAIKNKNFSQLAELVDPAKGLHFSPYAYVNLEKDLVFPVEQLKNLPTDASKYTWGTYDGSGQPIILTFTEYDKRFIYDRDFAEARDIGYNQIIGRGNTINNAFEIYPDSIIVEYYIPGNDTPGGEMAFRSLRLVFEKADEAWYLVALIHDEWTI